jgi:hypothetical protein
MASKGIMNDTMVNVNSTFFPGKLSFAKANPAIELSSIPTTTTEMAT